MDPILIPMIGVSIPVLALGGWIMETVLKSQERRMEMRLQAQQGKNEEVTQHLATLRTEIAGLRDTKYPCICFPVFCPGLERPG